MTNSKQLNLIDELIDSYLNPPWEGFQQFTREHGGESMMADEQTSVFKDGHRWIGEANGVPMGPLDDANQLDWILTYWRLRERRGLREQRRIRDEIQAVRDFGSIECVERQPWDEIRQQLERLKRDIIWSGSMISDLEAKKEAGHEPGEIVAEYLTALNAEEAEG